MGEHKSSYLLAGIFCVVITLHAVLDGIKLKNFRT